MSQETCEEINNLEVVIIKLPDDKNLQSEIPQENTSTSSSSTSSSSEDKTEEIISEEPPAKRRRRKRHPKKKKSNSTVACSTEEEPFPARYKNLPIFINLAVPKVHLRFDDEGKTDENKSEFNYKPRIISARSKNLELNENIKEELKVLEMEVTQTVEPEIIQEIISLKPRIIKAIGH